MVDLKRIDLVTQEDKLYHIDRWAALFKATTWEDIKIIAQNDTGITNAANTVWKLTQEEQVRLRCEAREDYYRRQRDVQLHFEELHAALAEQKSAIAEKDSIIACKAAIIALQADAASRSNQDG